MPDGYFHPAFLFPGFFNQVYQANLTPLIFSK